MNSSIILQANKLWQPSVERFLIAKRRVTFWTLVKKTLMLSERLLAQFGQRRHRAQLAYAKFVAEGVGQQAPWVHLQQQVFLGDEAFVAAMQAELTDNAKGDVNVPRLQRRPPPPPLAELVSRQLDCNQTMIAAHVSGAYSYQDIADYFGLGFTTVVRIVWKARSSAKEYLITHKTQPVLKDGMASAASRPRFLPRRSPLQ